jgi:hypothetical protein
MQFVASAQSVAALHTYSQSDSPLPSDTELHTQLTDCIKTISETTPSCTNVLPESASDFFSHYEHQSTVPISSLQSTLNKRANQHLFNAAVSRAESAGDTFTVARLKAITAPHAPDWKAAVPSNADMTLSDAHYRIAARINMGRAVPGLPPDCTGCGKKNIIRLDPYHYLSCNLRKRREMTLGHNMLVQVLYRYTNYTGGVAVKEPKDLHDSDGRVPDLQSIVNNQHILTDVQITHSLCPTHVQKSAQQSMSAARVAENVKTKKYTGTAALHDAKFIPFIMESMGGMSESAKKIYELLVLASRDNRTLWPHQIVARELRGAIAIAVQKRNAMTMIAGRCQAIGRAASCAA